MTRYSFPPSLRSRFVALLPLLLLLIALPARAQDDVAGAAVAVAIEAAAPSAMDAERSTPSDADDCLLCHRFPGLARLDAETGELRLFFVSERFHADKAGPHSRLACTGCHAREEVETVPHKDLTPVDCTQQCHLVTGSGAAVDFSHEGPAESLAKSVHAADVLSSQPYGAPLLRDGQSACLYCHDDPTYRALPQVDPVHRGVDPTVRCGTCHDDSLPVDTEHYLRHTAGRMSAQRPAHEAARVCAVCHSDEALNAKNEQHDAVTSYLRSFHGKASILGTFDAATCVDCHASEEGDPHLVLAAADPVSPTHADNRELTCRSVGCHANAVPDLSDAAVHMRVTPDDETIEYYLTAAFVILTVGTMTIYFAFVVLEALNAALRRQDDHHLRLVALARAVQAHPLGRERLVRLDVHQRFQHWALVIPFILLVLTGLPMKFAYLDGMSWLANVFGGLTTARLIHRASAMAISATFVYHVGYLLVLGWRGLGERRRAHPERSLVRHLGDIVWDWPMMVHPQDVVQFLQTFAFLLGLRKHRPEQGRFHFSQKFEYMAVFWGMTMIGTSGVMLWLEDDAARLVGGRALNFAFIVHSDEAFLALIYIAVVHFFAVVFSPSVFPLNLGSLTGDMPPAEMAENHLGYLRAVAAELGIAEPEIERPRGTLNVLRQLGRRSYAVLQAAFVAGVAWASLSFLVHELGGPETAIEVEEVPLRLDASALEAPAEHAEVGAGAAARNELQRGPLAHFHAIPTWYSPDPGTGCTEAGCHGALPHGKRKEVRAFLNMHTTFVDCQVCHRDTDLHGAELVWLTPDRQRREPPAVLRLASLLQEPPPTGARPAPWDEEVMATLKKAVEESGGDPELQRWLVALETSRVGGVLYTQVVEDIEAGIDRHGHGEYGARLGLPADSGKRWAPSAEQQAAIEQLRGPGASLHVDERKRVVEVVHRDLKKPEVECALCHTQDEGLFDFAALGYARHRVESLRSNAVARSAQAVEKGDSFFMPSILGDRSAPVVPADEGAAPLPEETP